MSRRSEGVSSRVPHQMLIVVRQQKQLPLKLGRDFDEPMESLVHSATDCQGLNGQMGEDRLKQFRDVEDLDCGCAVSCRVRFSCAVITVCDGVNLQTAPITATSLMRSFQIPHLTSTICAYTRQSHLAFASIIACTSDVCPSTKLSYDHI